MEYTKRKCTLFVNFVSDKLNLRGNQTIVNLNTENHVRAYAETMRALKIDDDGSNIQYQDFQNRFLSFFILTSTQDADVDMHFPM